MPAEKHLQLDEVLDFLKEKQDCAIVDVEGEHEVAINFDREASWHVGATLKESPDSVIKKKLKAAGLKVKSRELTPHFGPQRGKTIQFFRVAGDFKSAEAAARSALSILNILWQVPADQWLWVTAMQYDDRDDPKRPDVWPPARG